jgi:hypothetical protein
MIFQHSNFQVSPQCRFCRYRYRTCLATQRNKTARLIKSSVAEPHHFYAAPAPGENFAAAPAPTLLYSKAKFLKRTKV